VVLGAGAVGAVTIATNMAGRGTDIKLGRTSFVELLKHWKAHDLAPKKILDNDPKLDEAVIDLWSKRYLGDEAAEKMRGQAPQQILDAVNKERKQRGWHPLPLPSSLRAGADARLLGGLRIVGTERHDARRIDNQLRGRSGRQGDPGSSRFYLSLEDNLMKRFAGPTMANLMRSMGLKNGVPIESRMVSRSIEKAQKRVEEYNFGIRKNLLEYDQVMNLQRLNIYGMRQAILEGKELEPRYLRTVEDALDDLVQEAAADGTRGDALAARLAPAFEQELGLPAPDPTSIPVKDGGDACRARLMALVRSALDLRKTAFGPELYTQITRFVLLESIDRRWKDHIDFMDHLRRGIGLESYGQKDPKMRFKEEGFKSFAAMTKLIRHDVARIFFRLQVQVAPSDDQPPRNMFEAGGFQPRGIAQVPKAQTVPEIPAITAPPSPVAVAPEPSAPLAAGEKPKPDAPCPCGSGDLYKYCHGRV
jgi:preprotein translocase subunit SecA